MSVMGAALSTGLASNLSASGLSPSLVTQLLDASSGPGILINTGVRVAMANAIHTRLRDRLRCCCAWIGRCVIRAAQGINGAHT